MKRILLLALALAAATGAFGQLYKSIDKDGRVIYTDQPPPDLKSTPIKVNPGQPAAPPKTAVQRQKEQQQRESAGADKRKADEDAARRAKAKEARCASAKAQLRNLSEGGRFTKLDANGERVFLDEKQIEAERAAAQKAVDDSCNGS